MGRVMAPPCAARSLDALIPGPYPAMRRGLQVLLPAGLGIGIGVRPDAVALMAGGTAAGPPLAALNVGDDGQAGLSQFVRGIAHEPAPSERKAWASASSCAFSSANAFAGNGCRATRQATTDTSKATPGASTSAQWNSWTAPSIAATPASMTNTSRPSAATVQAMPRLTTSAPTLDASSCTSAA